MIVVITTNTELFSHSFNQFCSLHYVNTINDAKQAGKKNYIYPLKIDEYISLVFSTFKNFLKYYFFQKYRMKYTVKRSKMITKYELKVFPIKKA